jgi:hypothetical protein
MFKAKFKFDKFYQLFDQWKKTNGRLRKLEYKAFQWFNYLSSFGYLKIYIRNYPEVDDVGKKSEEFYDRFILYLPVRYCYGVLNTHDFSILMPLFQMMSEKSVNEETSKYNITSKLKIYADLLKPKRR